VFAYALYEREHPREPGYSLRDLTDRWFKAKMASLRERIAVKGSEEDI
jgi:hypothetical protein